MTTDRKTNDIAIAALMVADIRKAESHDFLDFGLSPDDGLATEMLKAIQSVIEGRDMGVDWDSVGDKLDAHAVDASKAARILASLGLHPDMESCRNSLLREYHFRAWAAMMPFLLEVTKKNKYYTHYQLKYILPMTSQYAMRLYELLKSYRAKTRQGRWFFEIDDLKKQLNCENYNRFPDFRRFALEPAVEQINKFTDIAIDELKTEKEGRKVSRVEFFWNHKNKRELSKTNKAISDALDGQIDMRELWNEEQNSVSAQFLSENSPKKE